MKIFLWCVAWLVIGMTASYFWGGGEEIPIIQQMMDLGESWTSN